MSKMILIIEDEESIQNIIKAFLEDAGYTVVLAADGLEGIEQFRANKPDLVLLDLMLPKIDGFAVCEILRKESRVPIIMLTALDDEESIQNIIKAFLEDAGYTVVLAADGLEGIEQFRANKPDLVLLDLMLPKIDGFAVCEILRKESRVPIIMLTALDDEDSQMKGFDALADDYITKPFSMPVVMKHIEAVLRRAEQGGAAPNTVIRYKEITVDTDSLTVLVGTESVSLTTREFEILKLLLENQGRVVSRERLLDTVWGYDYIGDEKIVNTHIKNIRKKLGVDYIETMRGAGYKIEKED